MNQLLKFSGLVIVKNLVDKLKIDEYSLAKLNYKQKHGAGNTQWLLAAES